MIEEGISLGIIGYGKQAKKTLQRLVEKGLNLREVRVYDRFQPQDAINNELQRKRIAAEAQGKQVSFVIDGCSDGVDELETLVRKADKVLITAATPGFADLLFGGKTKGELEGYIDGILSFQRSLGIIKGDGKEEREKIRQEAHRNFDFYQSLVDVTGIDLTQLYRLGHDGKPELRDRNPVLSPEKLKERVRELNSNIDYRCLRFLPLSAFVTQSLARRIGNVPEAKDKTFIIFQNQTDPNLYIFSDNSGLVDNVVAFNHTEYSRLLLRHSKHMPDGFEDPTVVGNHSHPSLILPRRISCPITDIFDAERDMADILTASDEYRFYSSEKLGIMEDGLGDDAAMAIEQFFRAIISGQGLVAAGVLMQLATNPLYRSVDRESLGDINLDSAFPTGWVGTFKGDAQLPFAKEKLAPIEEIFEKHKDWTFPSNPYQHFVTALQLEFARNLRAFEMIRGVLEHYKLIKMGGISPTEGMGSYGPPSPIEQKAREPKQRERIVVRSQDDLPDGMDALDRIIDQETARRKRDTFNREQKLAQLRESLEITLFAYTSGGSEVLKYDVLNGEESVDSFSCSKRRIRSIASDGSSLVAIVEGKAILFDKEGKESSSYTIEGQPEILVAEKEPSALKHGNLFVRAKGDSSVAIKHYEPGSAKPKEYLKRKGLGDCTHIELEDLRGKLTPYASIGNEVFSWMKEEKTGIRRYTSPSDNATIEQFKLIDKGQGHLYILFTQKDEDGDIEDKVYLGSTENRGVVLKEFDSDNAVFDVYNTHDRSYLCTLEGGHLVIRNYSSMADVNEDPVSELVKSKETFDDIQYIKAGRDVVVAVNSKNRVHLIDVETGYTLKKDFTVRGPVSTEYSQVAIEKKEAQVVEKC